MSVSFDIYTARIRAHGVDIPARLAFERVLRLARVISYRAPMQAR